MERSDNRLRKFKRYPEYRDSGVEWLGEIPAHWGRKSYKRIARLLYGDSLPDESRETGDVLVFGSNGPIGYHSSGNTNSPVIVIGRKGSYGKANYSGGPVFAIDTTYFIDRRCSNVNLKWLYYVHQLLDLDSYTEDSAIPGLSREFVYSKVIPEPPADETCAIAIFLDRETARIDALIAKKERLIELLQEKRTALITHAVTKGLEPDVPMKDSGVEWLGEIPENWQTKMLKRIAQLKSGEAITSSDINEKGEYPVYGGNGLRGYTSGFTHDGEFPLIGRQGALCGCVNYATGRFWASEHAVVARPNNGHSPLWLADLLRAMSLNQYSESAAQPGLAVENITRLYVPVPPVREQIEIAAYLRHQSKEIDSLIGKMQNATDFLKEYRTALISAAVTGKIDVREEVS